MKKIFLISGFLILILAAAFFSFRDVLAQSNQAPETSDLQAIKDKLDKIESDLQIVLENQEKTFVELKRGRYFTKRS